MTDTEEKLEILEFNYKVLKGIHKHTTNENEQLKKDYETLESRYKNTLNLYYESVVKQHDKDEELEKKNKELKDLEDKYIKMTNQCNALILEREDLRKKNKEVNRDFFIVSILMFISIALVIIA